MFLAQRKRLQQGIKDLKASLLQKGGFGRNLAVVFSGNVVGQVIGLLLMPIITRMYSPEDYGIFASFNAVIANFMVFAMLMYNHAFVLPKEEKSFASLLQLSLLFLGGYTLLLVVSLGLWYEHIFDWLNLEVAAEYWYFIPLLVFVQGLIQIMGGWNVRYKQFEKASILAIIQSITGRGVNLIYAFVFSASFLGLMYGHLFTFIAVLTTSIFLTLYPRILGHLKWVGFENIKKIAVEYKNYPLLVLPSNWVQTFSTHLPVLLFTVYTSEAFLGYYSFGNQLLALPLMVLLNAVSPVFLQKGVELKAQGEEEVLRFVKKTLLLLVLLGNLLFGALTVYGDLIFYYVFGAQWEEAGVIAGYLGVLFIFQLVWGASASLLRALRLERFLFIFGVLALILRVSSLSLGVIVLEDVYLGLTLFTAANILAYLYGISVLIKNIKGNWIRFCTKIMLVTGGFLSVLYLSRMLIEFLFFQ